MAGPQERHAGRGSTGWVDELIRDIGRLVASADSERYLDDLLALVGKQLGRDRYAAVRYRQYARPEVLVDHSMTEEATRLYYSGLYRLDPLFRMVRSGAVDTVFTFRSIREHDPKVAPYEAMFRLLMLQDELAVMLPELGGSYLGLCFESEQRNFEAEEISRVERLMPVLLSVHDLYLSRQVARTIAGVQSIHNSWVVVTDCMGQILRTNRAGVSLRQAEIEEIVRSITAHPPARDSVRIGSLVVHWETMVDDHPLAPGGRLFFVEEESAGFFDGDADQALTAFAQANRFSARERQIAKFILKGYPTTSIAKKINLTVGTVKNYKHRLYEKMNITTEREIFSSFVSYLFER